MSFISPPCWVRHVLTLVFLYIASTTLELLLRLRGYCEVFWRRCWIRRTQCGRLPMKCGAAISRIKLCISDSLLVVIHLFFVTLLIIPLCCLYIYGSWSWHTYIYAFGFSFKTRLWHLWSIWHINMYTTKL